jgi:predicted phage tail component-like protein
MRHRHTTDKIIFDGHDLSKLVMCRMERPILPPVDITETEVGSVGATFGRARLKPYDLPVTLTLRNHDRREVARIRHELAAMLYTEEPAPLQLPDDPDLYLLAIVSGDTSLGTITDKCAKATVNFHVCDPIFYGRKHTVDLSAGVAKTVDFGGTWSTRPTFTVTGTGRAVTVTNITTGDFVATQAVVPSGRTLVVDMALERATVAGKDVFVTDDSDFFRCKGRQALLVANGAAQVEWSERWL